MAETGHGELHYGSALNLFARKSSSALTKSAGTERPNENASITIPKMEENLATADLARLKYVIERARLRKENRECKERL
jgi:hypothetical protein